LTATSALGDLQVIDAILLFICLRHPALCRRVNFPRCGRRKETYKISGKRSHLSL